METTRSARTLAGLLGAAGLMHFVKPDFFDAIVPEMLPGEARSWTLGSGLAELAVAGAVAMPSTRRHGALAAAALFVAVFPANVKAAMDARTTVEKVAMGVRLPLQVPLVRWALKVARRP